MPKWMKCLCQSTLAFTGYSSKNVEKYDGFAHSFVVFRHITVHSQEKYFVLESKSCIYSHHIAPYALKLIGQCCDVPFVSLPFKWPLSVYTYEKETVVMNSNSHCCEIC